MNRIVFIVILVLIGLFNFKGGFATRFTDSQIALFIASSGILGSLLIREKNYVLGYLAGLCSIMFFKSYLLQQADIRLMYEMTLLTMCLFLVYYFVRHVNFKESILKFFMIPALLNSAALIVQKFDMYGFLFLPVEQVSGFIGNVSLSACYVALTIPIFLKYSPKLSIIAIFAVSTSGSFVATFAGLAGSVVYYYFQDKRIYRLIMMSLLLFLTLFVLNTVIFEKGVIILQEDLRQRLSMWAGTLHGISRNPILGWGVGSFESIVPGMPWQETKYLGRYFAYEGSVVNHPHNEFLLGWFTLGMMYLVVMYLMVEKIIKEFSKAYLVPFCILITGFIVMFGYFMTMPAWIVLLTALGIYDNREGKYAET